MAEMMKIVVNSPVKWGKLVKSWATGRSYMGPGTAPPKLPESIQELKDQCRDAGIAIDIPDHIKGLAFIHYSPETLAIRLPARAYLEQSEAQLLKPGSEYKLPAFYDEFFHNPPQGEEQMMDFHASRIGEYSINSCT